MRELPQAVLVVAAVALLHGCGGAPPPVGSLEVDAPRIDLPHRRFVSLGLSWRPQAPLAERSGELRVFVHLLDPAGNVVRTFDHHWHGPWRPGSRIDYRFNLHQSALAPPLAPGSYGLTIGLYDSVGHRWPLAVRGEDVDRHEYRVAEVRVPPESGDDPMYQFSADWLDSETGRDRQVLARRWLTGPGHLRAVGLERPGELWMRLLLPTPGAQQELVLVEGALQLGALITSDCGEVEVQLAGPGNHDVLLPLALDDEDERDSCAVEITPNFYLLELGSLTRRAVSLEVLAWSPREG